MFTIKNVAFSFMLFTALTFVSTQAFAGFFDAQSKGTKADENSDTMLNSQERVMPADQMASNLDDIKFEVKPNAENKDIDLLKDKTIDVAVLGASDFSVNNLDPNSITLEQARGDGNIRFEDINNDGIKDLILTFSTTQFQGMDGSKELKLRGMTKDGKAFEATETVSFTKGA